MRGDVPDFLVEAVIHSAHNPMPDVLNGASQENKKGNTTDQFTAFK
jgi:hypothetical protein